MYTIKYERIRARSRGEHTPTGSLSIAPKRDAPNSKCNLAAADCIDRQSRVFQLRGLTLMTLPRTWISGMIITFALADTGLHVAALRVRGARALSFCSCLLAVSQSALAHCSYCAEIRLRCSLQTPGHNLYDWSTRHESSVDASPRRCTAVRRRRRQGRIEYTARGEDGGYCGEDGVPQPCGMSAAAIGYGKTHRRDCDGSTRRLRLWRRNSTSVNASRRRRRELGPSLAPALESTTPTASQGVSISRSFVCYAGTCRAGIDYSVVFKVCRIVSMFKSRSLAPCKRVGSFVLDPRAPALTFHAG